MFWIGALPALLALYIITKWRSPSVSQHDRAASYREVFERLPEAVPQFPLVIWSCDYVHDGSCRMEQGFVPDFLARFTRCPHSRAKYRDDL